MSAQTQTDRVPAGCRRRCCQKATPGIGTDKSQALWGEKLYPKTGGKTICPFYPGLQNEVRFKWMNPSDNQRGGSAVRRARQRFIPLLQNLLLKRCGAGGLPPMPREGRRQVMRCCERDLPASSPPDITSPALPELSLVRRWGPALGFRARGLWCPPLSEQQQGGVCMNLQYEGGIFSVF